jgi:hypothetical protein
MRETSLDAIGRAFPNLVSGPYGKYDRLLEHWLRQARRFPDEPGFTARLGGLSGTSVLEIRRWIKNASPAGPLRSGVMINLTSSNSQLLIGEFRSGD